MVRGRPNPLESDRRWMGQALGQAAKAAARGEVPVGCVVVRDGEALSRAHNLRESTSDPTAHAEILALRKAAKKLGDWRLEGATCYVTLEPCLMCLGALKNARVGRLVFAAKDPKQGAAALLARRRRAATDGNDRPLEIVGGVMAEEAAEQLKAFFKGRRDRL